MTLASRAFQMLLLARMAPSYQAVVLGELGIGERQMLNESQQCPMSMPDDLDSGVDSYIRVLGPPRTVSPVPDPPRAFRGSQVHRFSLSIWPHLDWAVNVDPSGMSWGVGFATTAAFPSAHFDPALCRPGVWTRAALLRILGEEKVVDGWDEAVTLRYSIRGTSFEGEFRFGLLQRWGTVGPP